MNIEIFDPVKVELAKRVEVAKNVTCTDLRDKTQIETVKKERKELRGIEITIERLGKEGREDARTYAQKIIDMEKDLKKMTSPEIERFDKILDEAEKIKTRDERLLDLPFRKEKLIAVGAEILIDEEHLLSLDALQFQEYYATVVRIKEKADMEEQQKKIDAENEKIRIENEKIQKEREAIDAEKREIENQKQIKEAEERARVAEQQRMADEIKQKAEAEKAKVAEQERQKALLPDKEKLLEFATQLDSLQLPDVHDATMKAVTLQVKGLLFKVSNYIRANTV